MTAVIYPLHFHQRAERRWTARMVRDERARPSVTRNLHMITAPISSTYMAALVCISLTKRCLQCEMPNEMRLRFLEHLERMTDGVYLTSEIVAMVHPMCDDAYEIVKEAQTLGANEAIDVYARRDVFDAFVAKNPSLLKAIAAAEM